MNNPIPEGWQWRLFGDVYHVAIGGTPSRSNEQYWDQYKTNNNPWVSIKDLKGKYVYDTTEYISNEGVKNSNVKLVPSGTLMMSFKLTVGRTSFAGRDLYTNEAIAAFFPKQNDVDEQFVYQGLHYWNLLVNIDQAVKGVTLNKDKINQIEGLFPPLPEQKKIASILTSVDEVIEKTESQIAKLQDLKTGMMQELLTKGIGHTEFKDSPVGRIPVGWECKLLDKVAKRASGHTPDKKKPEYWNGGIKWVSLTDSFRLDRLYIGETEKNISALGIDNSSAVIHPANTVVMTRDAGIGKSAITTDQMAVSQHFMAWICGESLDKYFLYYLLQHWKPMFENIAMGSTIKTIGLPFFKALQIPLPPIAEQTKIAGALRCTDEKIFALNAKNEANKQIKKALMQDLLTGKVRVQP